METVGKKEVVRESGFDTEIMDMERTNTDAEDLTKNVNDQHLISEDKSLQFKNGKPYYPLHLRVKIVRDIEKKISENIEIFDAIYQISMKDNIDLKIIGAMWKRRREYFELDEKRKLELEKRKDIEDKRKAKLEKKKEVLPVSEIIFGNGCKRVGQLCP